MKAKKDQCSGRLRASRKQAGFESWGGLVVSWVQGTVLRALHTLLICTCEVGTVLSFKAVAQIVEQWVSTVGQLHAHPTLPSALPLAGVGLEEVPWSFCATFLICEMGRQ